MENIKLLNLLYLMLILNTSCSVHYHFIFSKSHKALHKIAENTKNLSKHYEKEMKDFHSLTNVQTHNLSIPVLIQQKISHLKELKKMVQSSEVHLNAIGDKSMIRSFKSQIHNLNFHILEMEKQKLEADQHLAEAKY